MRRILAVARNTVSQGLRMKVPLVLVIFIVVVAPALPLLLKSDGTAEGQARMILTYSLNAASVLICLLAVFLSVATLSGDIRERHVFVMDITPLRRWELLVGKWLGIVLLSSVLVITMGVTVYAMTKIVVQPVNEDEAKTLSDEVYTARRRVKPEPADIDALAREYYERYRAEGLIEKDFTEKGDVATLREYVKKHVYAVVPLKPREWRFAGLPQPEGTGEKITLRYKVYPSVTPPDDHLRCIWIVGDRQGEHYKAILKRKAHQLQEFPVPAALIQPDGSLLVTFVGLDNTIVVFDHEKGLEMLYRAGSFEANFVKAVALMITKVGFLAAVGLAAATFLNFHVASLAALFVLLTTSVVGHMAVIMSESGWTQRESVGAQAGTTLVQLIWRGLGVIFPDFSLHSGIARVAGGELISLWDVIWAWGELSLVRGGVALAIGAAILWRRELAELEE